MDPFDTGSPGMGWQVSSWPPNKKRWSYPTSAFRRRIEVAITDTSGFAHTFTVAASREKRKALQHILIGGSETLSADFTFPKEAGTNLYLFCRPHEQAGMIGTIEVEVK